MLMALGPEKILELPLAGMVEEFYRRYRNELDYEKFNELSLKGQLEFLNTPANYTDSILELSEQMIPGRITEFWGGVGYEEVTYFFNGTKGLYLLAYSSNWDFVLTLMAQAKKGLSVHEIRSVRGGRIHVERAIRGKDVDLGRYAAEEGHYMPMQDPNKPRKSQVILPSLRINKPLKKVNKKSRCLLEEALTIES
jgi:hypothetical protein